jgi:hypothetical protein
MTNEQKQQIQAYYQEGKNVNQIAAIYMIPQDQVKAILEEDIKITPTGTSGKSTKNHGVQKITVLDGAGVSEALFQDEDGI